MRRMTGKYQRAIRLLILLAVSGIMFMLNISSGLAARTYRTWEEAGVKLYSPREKDWTYVTEDNLEENIGLLTGHGFDANEARTRYASGEIVFEAYHVSALKDGCLRLQVIETEYTKKIWNHTELSGDARKAFLEDLKEDRHDLPFDFRAPKYETWAGGGKKNYIASGFVSMPPVSYESGRLNMQICNGKAYVLSYTAHHPQSRWDLVKDKEEGAVRERLKDMNLIMEKEQPQTQLAFDFPMVPMFARGGVSIRGESEEGAEISVACEGAQVYSDTKKDGAFQAEIFFDDEDSYVVRITAKAEGKPESEKQFVIQAGESVCPLMLEHAPAVRIEAGKPVIEGVTLPKTEVCISVGDKDYTVDADAQGRFSQEVDMQRHGDYTIRIEAVYEGLETGEIVYSVHARADQEEKIRQARRRNSNLSLKRFIQYADDHIGETVSYEARVDEIVYVQGGMHLRVSTRDENGDRQRYMLETVGYMEDQIYKEMRLTFYGEIQGRKTMTKGNGDTVELPCVKVDCAQWLVIDE